MTKRFGVVAFFALCLAACGGGSDGNGSGGNLTPAAKVMKLSLYGQPFVNSQAAVSHAQALSAGPSASAPPATASDAAATVQALLDALTARGVPSSVTAQVMDGTTLHQIVMGENSGLPPTPDQFKTDPSGYLIVSFQLDDMVTPWSDPVQAAAVTQFAQDLTVFAQRASVSGKLVYAVLPIQTCDAPNATGAAFGLISAITQAQSKSSLNTIGAIPFGVAFGGSQGSAIPSPELAHLGADCRTPDAYLLNMRTNAIADYIAALYKDNAPTAGAASGASAAGT
ncbi:hypothetical protein [Paraburkholderia bryophila]|uniref:Uncharacterized protein n=1 Tax=Paraburkholderia bryophila TaxID=420952 RepID=A0A7Z0AYI6_9BURK|nr:hypothetical protein [Paraburkholderia bryophila]NYH13417.1 hypothetical protein [Paraburkholderia bryophila]